MINIDEQRADLSKIGDEMLGLCYNQVQQAYEAFINFDTDIAEEVILKENKLFSLQIGEKTFKIDIIEQRSPKKS